MKKIRINSISVSVLICTLWIGAFALLTGWVGRDSVREQKEALEAALERDITTCYALEGFFPPDLKYLRDHYGLSFDEGRFYVDYRPVGSNIRPFYIVLERDESGEEPLLEVRQK